MGTVIFFAGALDGNLGGGPLIDVPDNFSNHYPPNPRPVIVRGYDTAGNLLHVIRGERRGDEATLVSGCLPGSPGTPAEEWRFWKFAAETATGDPVDGYLSVLHYGIDNCNALEYRAVQALPNLHQFARWVIPFADGEVLVMMTHLIEGIRPANVFGGPNNIGASGAYRDSINLKPPIREWFGFQRRLYWERFRRFDVHGYRKPIAHRIDYDFTCVLRDPDDAHWYAGGHYKVRPEHFSPQGIPHGLPTDQLLFSKREDLNDRYAALLGEATVRKFARDGEEIWALPAQTTEGWEGVLGLHLRGGYLYALQYRAYEPGLRLYLLKINPDTGAVLSATYTTTPLSDVVPPMYYPQHTAVVWGPDALYTGNGWDLRMIDYDGDLVAYQPGFRMIDPHDAYMIGSTVHFVGDWSINNATEERYRIYDADTFDEISRSGYVGSNARRAVGVDPETGVAYIGGQRNAVLIAHPAGSSNPWGYGITNWVANDDGTDLWEGLSMRAEFPGWNIRNADTIWGPENPFPGTFQWPQSGEPGYDSYDALVYEDGYGRTRGPDFYTRGIAQPQHDWWWTLHVTVINDMQVPALPEPVGAGLPTFEGDAATRAPGLPLGLLPALARFEREYVGGFRPDVYRVRLGDLELVPSLILGRMTADRVSASVIVRAPDDALVVAILERRGETMRVERGVAGLDQYGEILAVPFADFRFDRGHRNASATLSGEAEPEAGAARARPLSGVARIDGNRVELAAINSLLRVGDTAVFDGRQLSVTEIDWYIGPERAGMTLTGDWDA